MSLEKLYNRQEWHNNTTPALNETNLNILSKAVDDIDDRVIDIAGTVMETVPQVQEDLAEAQELLEDAEAINSHPPIIGQNGNWWTWDTSTNAYVDSGKDASVTVSVNPNTETLPAGSNAYVRNVGTSTDPVLLFGIPKGDKGETGGATPGSDVADTIVGEITASSATYPEPEEGETIKVIIGKIKKFLSDLKAKKTDLTNIATVESSTTASRSYVVGDHLILNGQYYVVTTAISQGGTIVTSGSGQNVDVDTVSSGLNGKQPKTLDTPLTIDGTQQTTVEGALGAFKDQSFRQYIQTTKSTSGGVDSFVFTGLSLTSTTFIDRPWCDVKDAGYLDMVVSGDTITVKYNSSDNVSTVALRIW